MVRFRQNSAKATQQKFNDVGIVYRDDEPTTDNGIIEDTATTILPISIDNGSRDSEDDDNNSVESVDSDDDDDTTLPSSHFLPKRRHHPAYTPHIFITHPHLAVLPVLLLEFLALALTRAVLPSLLLKRYESKTYIVMGIAECFRGVCAFFACPLFGRLSDIWGRRPCLFITVLGTLLPVCSLSFWDMGDYTTNNNNNNEVSEDIMASKLIMDVVDEGDALLAGVDAGEESDVGWFPTFGSSIGSITSGDYMPNIHRIDVFVVLLALSGLFSSTFTLTFAYISDVVKDRDGRVAAYGLALATFGLSFTIGPLLGGYLANVNDEKGNNFMKLIHMDNEDTGNDISDDHTASDVHPLGQHRVFITSLILAIMDLFYIHFLLPESLNSVKDEMEVNTGIDDDDSEITDNGSPCRTSSTRLASTSDTSNASVVAGVGVSRRATSKFWNPFDSVRYLMTEPLLSTIGKVTFLYYTALHAVVSTLVLYAARQFHMDPQRLGELMAALGLSTMISEVVLVRIAIPLFGETRCMRIGLISFALQCVLLAVADSSWHLFACAFLAMAGNLVYPSVSSLVSSTVKPEQVGRALGAINGVKALTEGIGPLLFGTLLTMSEKDSLPGWPYFLASIMVGLAYQVCRTLPDDESELYIKTNKSNSNDDSDEEYLGLVDSTIQTRDADHGRSN